MIFQNRVSAFVFDQVEGLAVGAEAGIVQNLRNLQHDLPELVHGNDHNAPVGGLNALLLQMAEEGIEVLVRKVVSPLQGDGPVTAGQQ